MINTNLTFAKVIKIKDGIAYVSPYGEKLKRLRPITTVIAT